MKSLHLYEWRSHNKSLLNIYEIFNPVHLFVIKIKQPQINNKNATGLITIDDSK